jgi:hypothetical protein
MRALGMMLMALAVLGPSPSLSADTLVIESVVQSADVARPSKGESMAAVEARYGKPAETAPAVGQPPITRWVYERFTVYFEGDSVVHAVVKR